MKNATFVEVVDMDTDEVVKRMGPMGEHGASKVSRGVQINLNHDRYFVRTVKEETP